MTNGTQTIELERRLTANPSSALFARLAETLLKNGETSRAERLCEKGLEFHTGYSTGRLIHARCLAARGLYGKAIESLDELARHYPGNILLAELGDEWRSCLAGDAAPTADDGALLTGLTADLPPAEPIPADPTESEAVKAEPTESEAVEAEPVRGKPMPAGPVQTETIRSDPSPGAPSPVPVSTLRIMEDRPAPVQPPVGDAPYPRIPPAPETHPPLDFHRDQESCIPRGTHPALDGKPSVGAQLPAEQPPAGTEPVLDMPLAGEAITEEASADAGDASLETGLSEAEPVEIRELPLSGVRDSNSAGVPPPMPVPSPHAAPVPLLQPIPRSWKGPGFIEGGRIVSRTLAEIYASQGAIGEAVETYRILLNRKPEMRDELEPRLRELEERLRTDQGPRPSPGNAKAPA